MAKPPSGRQRFEYESHLLYLLQVTKTTLWKQTKLPQQNTLQNLLLSVTKCLWLSILHYQARAFLSTPGSLAMANVSCIFPLQYLNYNMSKIKLIRFLHNPGPFAFYLNQRHLHYIGVILKFSFSYTLSGVYEQMLWDLPSKHQYLNTTHTTSPLPPPSANTITCAWIISMLLGDPVQESNVGRSKTHLLPWIHKIHSYTCNIPLKN